MATIGQVQVGEDVYDIAESGYAISNQYSTEEKIVGTWINSKPLYQKTLNCGSMPNNTTKEVAHNITNMDKCVFLNGVFHRTDDDIWIDLSAPRMVYQQVIMMSVSKTHISFTTGFNWNNITDMSYVTLQYTKTTD